MLAEVLPKFILSYEGRGFTVNINSVHFSNATLEIEGLVGTKFAKKLIEHLILDTTV